MGIWIFTSRNPRETSFLVYYKTCGLQRARWKTIGYFRQVIDRILVESYTQIGFIGKEIDL